MATIRTAIQIHDGMSPAFRAMNNAMNIVISSFESLQSASGNAVDTASIQAARRELTQAESAFSQIEEEIRQANQQQQNFNNSVDEGTHAASGLFSKLAGIAATYLGLQSAGKVIALSDELTNTTARLDLMNDGFQTTAELQKMIFDSAQRSYGAYAQTADLVAKLGMNAGDAFSSNAETIQFAELLNKQFGIAGTAADGISAATLQLTQALGSGVLRGEELNSVFEQAPNIIHTIADYLGVGIGQIRSMASEGMITADIVKKAMFAASDDINDKFNSMPLTFSQIWTAFKNEALWAFQPVLQKLNEIANNDKFQSMVSSTVSSLATLSSVALSIFSVLMTMGSLIYDNWSLFEPVIWGITAAVGAYTAALIINKGAQIAGAFWTGAKTLATGLLTATTWASVQATFAATGAAWGLNAALAANPVMIVVLAIILLISILYGAVAAINHFAGTSISATGIVAGAFMVLGTFIYNAVAYMWNIWASFLEFIVNIAQGRTYAIRRLFGNLANNVLDYTIAMTSGWDNFATNMANAFITAVNTVLKAWNWLVSKLPDDVASSLGLGEASMFEHRTSITSDLSNIKGKINDWVGEAPSDYWEAPKMDMKSVGDAWNTGYNWGANLFNKDKSEDESTDKYQEILEQLQNSQNAYDKGASSGKDTAANTAKMADSMEASAEELKYLRDLAEQEVVNRFTTAEIKIDMSNMQNSINNEMDLDGVVAYLEEKVHETMTIAAEGVHD